MATGGEVLGFLLPAGGWYIAGNEYEGIQFLECAPITKEAFTAGFAAYDALTVKQEAEEAAALTTAQAKLAALGLTAADLKALGL
jgi:hypothetical protein